MVSNTFAHPDKNGHSKLTCGVIVDAKYQFDHHRLLLLQEKDLQI